jgi:hypothetical protein
VTAALERDQVTAGQLRQTDAVLVGDDPVVGPVDDDHRTPHPRAQLLEPSQRHARGLGSNQRLAVGRGAPAQEVLDELGGVWLGHQLVEEELGEAPVVAQPRVPVVASPAVVDAGVLVPLLERYRPVTGKRP